MRRVSCQRCGVTVEEVPWAKGKHRLTRAYMQFLAHWARKLSWKEVAESFQTSWEKVCHSVEYVVQWGLRHRVLEPVRAIGVDEIQYARGHNYLTLVYQIEEGPKRLLWVGKDRTIETLEGFFAMLGESLSAQIEFVCSDMWQPYLRVIREKCSQAIHILDRFHIVAKMNKALDEVRAGEARKMVRQGYEPLLKKTRWCLLKRKDNLSTPQRFRLRDLLHYNLATVRAYLLKEDFQQTMGEAPGRRSDEEGRPHAPLSPPAHSQLFPRQKTALLRCRGRSQQQSQTHHEKILRIPDVQNYRTRSVSRTWKATRTTAYPQILLTRLQDKRSHAPRLSLPNGSGLIRHYGARDTLIYSKSPCEHRFLLLCIIWLSTLL